MGSYWRKLKHSKGTHASALVLPHTLHTSPKSDDDKLQPIRLGDFHHLVILSCTFPTPLFKNTTFQHLAGISGVTPKHKWGRRERDKCGGKNERQIQYANIVSISAYHRTLKIFWGNHWCLLYNHSTGKRKIYYIRLEIREQTESKNNKNTSKELNSILSSLQTHFSTVIEKVWSWHGCEVNWTHFLNRCEVDWVDSSKPVRALRGGPSSLLAVSFGRVTAGLSRPSCVLMSTSGGSFHGKKGEKWRSKNI